MATDSRPPRPKPYELNKSTSSSTPIRVSQSVANGRDLPDSPTPLHPPGREANNGLGSSHATSSTTPAVPPRPTDFSSSSAIGPYRGYGTSGYPGGSSYSSYNSPYSSYGSSYNSSPYSSYGRYGSSPYGSSYSSYGSSYRSPYSSYGGYGSSYGGYGSSYGGGYGSSYGGYGSAYGGGMGYNRMGPNQENPNGGVFNGALQTGYNQINKFGQVVESFSNFSRLLDANFDAVHGSFASILRLMEVFGEFFFVIRSFALFRFFTSAAARLSGTQPLLDDGRRKDSVDVSDFLGGKKRSQRTIPFLLLLAAISVSTPILIARLWNALKGRRTPDKLEGAWNETAENITPNPEQTGPLRGLARAVHDFQGETPRDLSFRKDETIDRKSVV